MTTDPITLRTFYGEGKRRKSGISNKKMAKGGALLGGDAMQQGISLRNVHQSRGLLPVFAGEKRYKTIIERRIESGNRRRVVYDYEDPRENDYFVDSTAMIKSRYLIKKIDAVTDITWVRRSNDSLVTDEALLSLLDKEFYEYDETEEAYYIPTFSIGKDANGYIWFIKKLPTTPPKAIIEFPDGGIRQVPDYSINIITYGTGRDYLSTTPYTDLQKFDAIKYVNESGPLGMFPEISKSPSYTADMIYDGVIEPFVIRQRLYGKSILGNDEDQVYGGIAGYAPEKIEFMFPVSDITRPSGGWFEDIGGTITRATENFKDETATTAIDNPEYVTDTNFHLDAYIDRDSYDSVFVDEEMENVLISMDATLDEGYLPFSYIDMAVGHTAPAKERFGSIVYRDMLR